MRFKQLNALTKNIWEFCMKKGIWVSAATFARKDNMEVEADYERNVNTDAEWQLNPNMLRSIIFPVNLVPRFICIEVKQSI